MKIFRFLYVITIFLALISVHAEAGGEGIAALLAVKNRSDYLRENAVKVPFMDSELLIMKNLSVTPSAASNVTFLQELVSSGHRVPGRATAFGGAANGFAVELIDNTEGWDAPASPEMMICFATKRPGHACYMVPEDFDRAVIRFAELVSVDACVAAARAPGKALRAALQPRSAYERCGGRTPPLQGGSLQRLCSRSDGGQCGVGARQAFNGVIRGLEIANSKRVMEIAEALAEVHENLSKITKHVEL